MSAHGRSEAVIRERDGATCAPLSVDGRAAAPVPEPTAKGRPAPTLASRPRVGAGFRLQWEPVQNCHVLLYPEGMVKLNGSAGAILARCDGAKDVGEIVAELEAAFTTQGLQRDVLAFVEMAGQQRWLAWDDA